MPDILRSWIKNNFQPPFLPFLFATTVGPIEVLFLGRLLLEPTNWFWMIIETFSDRIIGWIPWKVAFLNNMINYQIFFVFKWEAYLCKNGAFDKMQAALPSFSCCSLQCGLYSAFNFLLDNMQRWWNGNFLSFVTMKDSVDR